MPGQSTDEARIDLVLERLQVFGWQPDHDGCLVVTCNERPVLPKELDRGLNWLSAVSSVDDLQDVQRHPYALVFDQLSHMGSQQAVHLLARLRDCYADRVLVVDEQGVIPPADMLSLGFLPLEPGLPDALLYGHDPDTANPRRDWNNASQWANPENFTRYRW